MFKIKTSLLREECKVDENVYEKVVTGRNLNRIFNKNLDAVENYTVHVETVNGTKNNYICKAKGGEMEINDLYVSDKDITDLKTV